METVPWLLVQCLDNPALQAHELLSQWHAGCVVRCLAGCRGTRHGQASDADTLLACCTECRSYCMKSSVTAGMDEALLVVLMVGLLVVAMLFGPRAWMHVRKRVRAPEHSE